MIAFKNWQNNLHLVRELALTDFKLKYQGSVMSYLWSLVKPLSSFTIMYVIFVKFLNIDIDPAALFLGIVMWNYFADLTSGGLKSIVDNGGLIRKIYFPHSIIVIASSLSAFITLVLNLIAVFIFMIIVKSSINITAPFLIIYLVELYVIALGASLLLSSLYVRFRDISHIWEVVLQILFYSSGVLYVISAVPNVFRPILAMNPLVQIVQDSRNVLLSNHILSSSDVLAWPLCLIPYTAPIIILVVGLLTFKKMSKNFAENV